MACVAAGVSMVLSAWATRFALEPRVFFSFIGFSSSEAHATEHTTRNTRIPVEAGALRADPRARRRAPIPAHPEPHDVHDLPCECSVVLPWNQFLPWDQFFACAFFWSQGKKVVPRQTRCCRWPLPVLRRRRLAAAFKGTERARVDGGSAGASSRHSHCPCRFGLAAASG